MRWTVAVVLVALAACGDKEPEDTGPTQSCADLGTEPLSGIPVGDWPAGLDGQIDPYEALAGVYTADSCAGPVNVKIDQMPQIENVDVVTSPVDASLPCGCTSDEGLVGSDNELGAYAYANNATIYVDSVDDALDPAVDGTVFSVSWAFLPSSTGYAFRGCGAQPAVGNHDAVTIALRVDANGYMSGTVEATGGTDDPYTCELTNFVLVTAGQ